MRIIVVIIVLFIHLGATAQPDSLRLTISNNEFWWSGLSALGHTMPFNATTNVSHDMWGTNMGNQAQPLLLSSKGRYIWSDSPIKYQFIKGSILVTTRDGEIVSGDAGKSLEDAYDYVSMNFFPPSGVIPEQILFNAPQYNTWIELKYNQNQGDILKYASDIVKNGFPPGVIMIDDNWQEDYGVWEFSKERFSDPKQMVDSLHNMGFKVMMWVCPFVSPDSETFRNLAKDTLLLRDKDRIQKILWANTANKSAIIHWWNGASACLDLSNPKTQNWFKNQLNYLVDKYGVDGFKFDAGDANFYKNEVVAYNLAATPNDHTTYFAQIGLDYPLNEYRASWKLAGQALSQRLRDKKHSWEDLQKLIPDQLSSSLMGYAYTCPDMIGGGDYISFVNDTEIDEELIVRSSQVHALMPMMQFSVAPWRILSKQNTEICLSMVALHQKMSETILDLAKESANSGMPIVRPMELVFPMEGYEEVIDQFVLGDNIIVAPVIKKGVRSRQVILPRGKWQDDYGKIHNGGKSIKIDVPLSRLPYFTRVLTD